MKKAVCILGCVLSVGAQDATPQTGNVVLNNGIVNNGFGLNAGFGGFGVPYTTGFNTGFTGLNAGNTGLNAGFVGGLNTGFVGGAVGAIPYATAAPVQQQFVAPVQQQFV